MAEQARLDEIVSLNADDLDVEELEQRLELAMALFTDPGKDPCSINCPPPGSCTNFCHG